MLPVLPYILYLDDAVSDQSRMRVDIAVLLSFFHAEIAMVFVVQVIGDFFFMFFHLAIKFCHQSVDRCIHVIFSAVGKNVMAAHVYGGFCSVPNVFDSEDNVSISDFIEVAFQA
jgi:hypothetical protein